MKEVLGEEMNVDDQDDPAWIVAHRAACLDAPENSLEAVRLAAKNGAKWIEFDVSFSSDLIGVAFHDDTLERVTMTSGQVDSLTYTQLAELDLAHKHPLSASFNNVKIISVKQFVAECVDLNLKMIIDLKPWELPDETVNLIISLPKQFPTLKTTSIITSFYPNLLYKLRSSDPQILTAISTRPNLLSLAAWEGASGGERRGSQASSRWWPCSWTCCTTSCWSSLWWMLGLSAVLVHRAVVTRDQTFPMK